MCGRFQLSVKGKHISKRYQVELFDQIYQPNYNCAPGQRLPVIVKEAKHEIKLMKWGLVPSWAKDTSIGSRMINARSETVFEKSSFKKAILRQRCLIPASGFYEWSANGTKVPYHIYCFEEDLFAMAGIWESWKDSHGKLLQTFSILTTEAQETLKHIHHRMPLILEKNDEPLWLQDLSKPDIEKLIKPYQRPMGYYPVSNRVNSTSNNDASLLDPVDLPGQTFLF